MLTLSLFDDKVVILFTMFVVTVCFALIPKKLVNPDVRPSPAWKRRISLLSCFSGGVFVAACLLDLFPDVRESIDHVLDEIENTYHTKVDYPVAEFIIVMGFFLVLIIEQVVLDYKESGGGAGEETDGGRREPAPLAAAAPAVDVSERQPLIARRDRAVHAAAGQTSSGHGTFVDSRSRGGGDDEVEEAPDPVAVVPEGGQNHHHRHDHEFEHSSLRSILLLVALSFHSVFEGLAIGLQLYVGGLISIFTAVIMHKAIMAFSLGLTMAQSPLSRRSFLISVLIFSAASPVGMAVGMALTDLKKSLTRDVANGVLQGLSGGTFLYITFFEVLPHELKTPNDRMLRLLCVLLGYSCICGLLFITH